MTIPYNELRLHELINYSRGCTGQCTSFHRQDQNLFETHGPRYGMARNDVSRPGMLISCFTAPNENTDLNKGYFFYASCHIADIEMNYRK